MSLVPCRVDVGVAEVCINRHANKEDDDQHAQDGKDYGHWREREERKIERREGGERMRREYC